MQVKKFEAKTMNEALQMVKIELGPEAIILSAKDHKKGYGIGGEASVELTAAISETKYKERQFALARLKEEEKQKMNLRSAKTQKKFIDKSVSNYYQEQRVVKQQMLPSRARYISIDDEDILVKSVKSIQEMSNKERLKKATMSALSAMDKDFIEPKRQKRVAKKIMTSGPVSRQIEVGELKREILRLNSVITKFQEMPQTFISSHPGADYGLESGLSFMFEKLIKTGMNRDISAEILHLAKKEMLPSKIKKKALVEAWVAKYILDQIRVTGDSQSNKIEVFLGGSGSGKTSSIVKYASHQIIRHKKSVAIITTDTMKMGAVDQLRIYAKILNIPFAVIHNESDWEPILSQLGDVDSILVDTPGVSLKDIAEIDLIRSKINPVLSKSRVHYVMSVSSGEYPALELAKRYKMFHYHDVICTKLDESPDHGIIYTMNKKLDMPLHSFGIGSKIPEDFEFATRERVLDLLFKITKAKG